MLILNGDGPLLRPETLQAVLDLHRERRQGGAIVTTVVQDPTGYGRIVRDDSGLVAAIVEQKSASPDQLKIREINPGVYCFDSALFWQYVGEVSPDNAAGEYYLTDMVEIMSRHGHCRGAAEDC